MTSRPDMFSQAEYTGDNWGCACNKKKMHKMKNAPAPKERFCNDCKNFRSVNLTRGDYDPETGKGYKEICLIASSTRDPVNGIIKIPSIPRIKNRNYDCQDHVRPGTERIRRGDIVPISRKPPWYIRLMAWFSNQQV
jgi:hypothetical protein